MIEAALWNIFRNVNMQIFEEMKVFCLFNHLSLHNGHTKLILIGPKQCRLLFKLKLSAHGLVCVYMY